MCIRILSLTFSCTCIQRILDSFTVLIELSLSRITVVVISMYVISLLLAKLMTGLSALSTNRYALTSRTALRLAVM